MKLLTKQIEKKLEKNPLYKNDGKKPEEVEVIVKFFNPYGIGTWYVTEAERMEDGDWMFFGLVEMQEVELGYFTFKELESLRINVSGMLMPIERDMYFDGTLANAYKECEKLR